MRVRVSISFLSALAILATLGCNQTVQPEVGRIEKSSERGPIRVVVGAAPSEPWVGDPVIVELRVTTPADYVVRFPKSADLGELTVSAIEAPSTQPSAGGTATYRQAYRVETSASGKLEILPLTVQYAKKLDGGVAPETFDQEIATDSLAVDVRSALTTQDSTQTPRDITGTIAAPWKAPPIWLLLTIALAVCGAAYLLWRLFYAVRMRIFRGAQPLTPEEWAIRELERLRAEGVSSPDALRALYFGMTDAVRRYIELKFGLRAPEMTTGEFLRDLAVKRGALPYDRDSLGAFLEACDIVKYAALVPGADDAAAAIQTAITFVRTTAEAARPDSVTNPDESSSVLVRATEAANRGAA